MQHSELQRLFEQKSSQLAALQHSFTEAQQKIEIVETKMKKLRYENEKLFADHESLKTKQSTIQTLSEESYRKKIKSMTGELEMFDAFTESFYQLCMALPMVSQSAKH